MSERLTKRTENGGVQFSNGEYWNTVYPQNEHCLTDIHRMAIKLCDLEDKIEQGKIVELPCAVGQTVYHFSRDLGAVFPYFVENLNIGSMGKNKTYWNYEANYHDEETDELVDEIDFDLDDLGETVFLDRASAEAKVREMEGDNNA